ncbi:Citramalyl-CoA lyase [Fusarium oxysporum f. sp. albedinis]|nr:Citramalyl-CoA lyase [Fusarium oxysporum f. sp. albedinis]
MQGFSGYCFKLATSCDVWRRLRTALAVEDFCCRSQRRWRQRDSVNSVTTMLRPVSQQQSCHHHHHLPNSETPFKLMGLESGLGGALRIVVRIVMPGPPPSAQGPRLTFTPKDD